MFGVVGVPGLRQHGQRQVIRASLQGGEMANRENTGKYGKSGNYIKMNGFVLIFCED